MQSMFKRHSRSLSILTIDDSTSERILLRAMLQRLGHVVTEAETGLQALKYLYDKSREFDLVFLDVRMSGIDGFETAQRIRVLERNRSEEWHPIIFLSGQTSPKDLAQGIEAGGDDYLTKPVNAIVLKSKITAMQRIADMRQRLLAAKQQLEVLAHTDELTQLANRRRLCYILESELARARRHKTPLSIAYMDLDHFKQINDTHGHDAGDAVLRSVAELLSTHLRVEDSIGRLGGEEFCICLPGTDASNSREPCERYRSLIEHLPIHTNSQTLRITASFGLTSFLPDSDDCTCLLTRADQALYRAKKNGRNRVEVV